MTVRLNLRAKTLIERNVEVNQMLPCALIQPIYEAEIQKGTDNTCKCICQRQLPCKCCPALDSEAHRQEVETYWLQHPQVKEELDAVLASLIKRYNDVSELRVATDLEANQRINAGKEKIQVLEQERQNLSVFSVSEKRALQATINQLALELATDETETQKRLERLNAEIELITANIQALCRKLVLNE